jgi:hypothetical protein
MCGWLDSRRPDPADPRGSERDLDAFAHGGWTSQQVQADKMHALLVERADALMGCTEGSPEEAELTALTDAIEAYKAVRWPQRQGSGRQGLGTSAAPLS